MINFPLPWLWLIEEGLFALLITSSSLVKDALSPSYFFPADFLCLEVGLTKDRLTRLFGPLVSKNFPQIISKRL
jgi:hypothetical protein